MPAEALDAVLRAAWVLTMLIPLLVLLRPVLMRIAGPGLVYAAWGVVPLAVLASTVTGPVPVLVQDWRWQVPTPAALLGAPSVAVPMLQAWGLVIATFWATGALLMGIGLWWAQGRYRAELDLQPDGRSGMLRARAAHAVPALIGCWRPRLVLPMDFESRYTPQQQRLILAHEDVHARRRDPLAHLLACVLRVLFWFHPLIHWAHHRMRHDQELACDQAVLSRHPGQRRAYAEALLLTQLDRPGLPVGCTWQSSHPLIERVTMLKQPFPNATRRWTARLLLAGLALGASLMSWAADVDWEPQLLEQALPQYPKAALDARQAGKVIVVAEVLRDGSVGEVRIDTAEPAGVFDDSALASVRQTRFAPAPATSRASAAWVQVPITYSLNEAD